MKQKLKEGDVVMILPHTSGMTQQLTGEIGIVDKVTHLVHLQEYLYSVSVNFYSLGYGLFYQDELLKIGTL